MADNSQSQFDPQLTPPQAITHFGRGILMGGADVIPGVSGGTVALILGIYERLVNALSGVDATFLGHLKASRWRDAAHHLDLWFLISLVLGIATGILALGTVMHTLLENYRQPTYAAFFGMIAASCWMVARLIHRWRPAEFVLLGVGAVFAYWLVSQEALTDPPDSLWYIFFCGVVGICAMILPGISGAFILLILGKYHELTGIIKQVLHLELTVQSVLVVLVFATGCVLGLLSFSKLLKWLLSHYGSLTMAVLCGFMAGSLRKIWPFQIDTTPEMTDFKDKIFELIPLHQIPMDGTFWATVGVGILAASAVFLLDRLATPSADAVVEDEAT